jgi:hypothetical protein
VEALTPEAADLLGRLHRVIGVRLFFEDLPGAGDGALWRSFLSAPS